MNEFWTSILRDPQLEAYWEKKENLVGIQVVDPFEAAKKALEEKKTHDT